MIELCKKGTQRASLIVQGIVNKAEALFTNQPLILRKTGPEFP